MFMAKDTFSSFSVDDLAKAKQFYGDTLGLAAEENAMGVLNVRLPAGPRARGRRRRRPGQRGWSPGPSRSG